MLFDEAMDFFDRIRTQMSRPPGTAELLAWLDILETVASAIEQKQGRPPLSLLSHPELLVGSLGALAKTQEDLERATAQLQYPTRA